MTGVYVYTTRFKVHNASISYTQLVHDMHLDPFVLWSKTNKEIKYNDKIMLSFVYLSEQLNVSYNLSV